ncbi:hypothetical protein ATCVNEJV2_935R [Acanthocystis turfacea Chlorella virus NE-JV-2]|nr:hypothetical protein ATCVNEJV2_935R [Acanthocystis turfacea Chlorella virus NE-JV-2]
MSIISTTSYTTAHDIMSSTNYSTAVSMESFFEARETMPETMMMPEWLIDIEAKNAADIKAIMISLSEREKIETAVYLFMQGKHNRPGDYDAYVGDDEFSYNELALFSPAAIVDAVFSNEVAIYKQAPERSGKTKQLFIDTLICVHRNWVGMVGIGSPKDNVIGVHGGLEGTRTEFKDFITSHYPKTNAAFEEVFGAAIYGPSFEFFDGKDSSLSEKSMFYILNGKTIPVFSAMKPQPVKAMLKVFNALKAAGKSYFVQLDEADSVIRPIASSVTKKMAVSIETILGMRENIEFTCACGDVHVCSHSASEKATIGTFGGAKKIMLLSATMNLPVEVFNIVGSNRPKVMKPYTERAISLIGGVDEHNAIVSSDQLSFTTGYFSSTNPETTTGRFAYFLDNDCVREQGEDFYRAPRSFWSKKPFMPIGAEAPGKFKTNSVLLIQLTSMVNGGRQNAETETEININQKNILAGLCGGIDSRGIVRDGAEGRALGVLPDTIFITFFAGGAKIRGDNKVDKSVKDIIRADNLYAKIEETLFDKPEQEAEAVKVVKSFETADEDVENTMKFVSWYYGMHRPVVVITFNKGQRAVDMRDRYHVVSHMLMHAADSRGMDSLKQQAGRTKGSKGEFLKCNYPPEFVPTIVCNKSLANCSVHEQLVFFNDIDENGKRIIPRENMLAIEEDRVLDKPNRLFEPKIRGMTVIVEDGEEEFISPGNSRQECITNVAKVVGRSYEEIALNMFANLVHTKYCAMKFDDIYGDIDLQIVRRIISQDCVRRGITERVRHGVYKLT